MSAEPGDAAAKLYLADLARLEALAAGIPNSRFLAIGKVITLVQLNMRWERVMFDRSLDRDPRLIAAELVRDAERQLRSFQETSFIQASDRVIAVSGREMETVHHDLFQTLWVNFSPEDYEQRIERYVHRLRVNGLCGDWLAGRRCIDFGCGHGNFAHALLREGAAAVVGIDFGEASVRYARSAQERLGVPLDRLEFRVESVYGVSEPDDSFDFAIQNGVFHHLDDEDRAYREMFRVLRPGGAVWVYTDGAGGISYDLWDASVRMLRDVPEQLVLECLDFLEVENGKRYHLGDGLNATYRHTAWDEITTRLASMGFVGFRRLVGGFPTDFDHDVVAADPYGRVKFGEGDIRLLAEKPR